MAASPASHPCFAYELAFPDDDSFRSYVDPSWLRLLGHWIELLGASPLRLHRRFYVMTSART